MYTRSSFTDRNDLSPQHLSHYANGIPTDDMDWSPLSPILLSDVDMDILTDTPATPWTRWNTNPVPPFHYNAFGAPTLDSIWKTPVQEPPPPATQHSSGFVALTTLYASSFHAAGHMHCGAALNDSFISAVPEPPVYFSNPNILPPTYHPCGPYTVNDRIQDTDKTHRQELPHRITTPHPSITTLLNEFERSLTLVSDESTSFEADSRSDYNGHFKHTPACAVEDELRVHSPRTKDSSVPLATLDPAHSNDHSFEREATEPLEEGQDQTHACSLNLHDPLSLPFERESTPQPHSNPPPSGKQPNVPLKKGESWLPACFLDSADRPRPPLDPTAFPTHTVPGLSASPSAARAAHPFARPRPPTPPPSRRPSKPVPRHNTRTTHFAPYHLASTGKRDHAELSIAQASVQARKSAQTQLHLSAAPCRAQVLRDEEMGMSLGRSGWDAPSGRRMALGAARRTFAPVRCSRRRREEPEEGKGEEDRVRTRRARFVLPDSEDEGKEAAKSSPATRPRWTGRDGTKPLRSILRNKHAMPYDKAMVRHRVRRASVP